MKRLAEFSYTEGEVRPIIKTLPIIFDNEDTTYPIAIYHAKKLINQYRCELQILASN